MPKIERPAPMVVGNGAAISVREEQQQNIATGAEPQGPETASALPMLDDDCREIAAPVHIGEILKRVLAKVAVAVERGMTWEELEAALSQRKGEIERPR